MSVSLNVNQPVIAARSDAPVEMPPNLAERVIGAVVGLIVGYPDVLTYATVGAIVYGLPGATIGVAAAFLVRSQIVPQDDPSRRGMILSRHQPTGPCGLKGCKHC